MRILITGGSGFIGSNYLLTAVQRGDRVLNIDNKPPQNPIKGCGWVEVDLLDLQKLRNVIGDFKPEIVVHLAARCDLGGQSIEDYHVNTKGTSNLLEVLDSCSSVKRVIFASSMLVCRPGYIPDDENDFSPSTPYGESKMMMEKVIRESRIRYEWAIVRPTSIWGPGFSEPYRNFFDLVSKGKYFHVDNRGCTKTYGYIGNTVFQLSCLLSAPSEKFHGRVFYLGDYKPTNIEEWADEIASEYGLEIKRLPWIILRILAIFGDICKLVGLRFPLTSFRLKNMTTDNIVNTNSMSEIAPKLPYSRIKGINNTIKWLKNEMDGKKLG